MNIESSFQPQAEETENWKDLLHALRNQQLKNFSKILPTYYS